jgi:protein-disulfide isomerase
MTQDGTDLSPAPSSADHVRGSLDAPVVITEFADFECPYCGAAHPVIESVRKAFGARVALVFRHFPLSMHPHAQNAAEAAEAAGATGKFWEMHDLLFENQERLSNADLERYAEASAVAAKAVREALEHRTYRAQIERDVASGRASGIEGTPALFINGFAYEDEVTVEALGAAIEQALGARSGV